MGRSVDDADDDGAVGDDVVVTMSRRATSVCVAGYSFEKQGVQRLVFLPFFFLNVSSGCMKQDEERRRQKGLDVQVIRALTFPF